VDNGASDPDNKLLVVSVCLCRSRCMTDPPTWKKGEYRTLAQFIFVPKITQQRQKINIAERQENNIEIHWRKTKDTNQISKFY
jgi:hypothetical protein